MRPTRLAWLLLLIGAALAALPAWVAPSFAAAWLGYVMGVLALGALDGALATRLGALAPRIVLAPALPVGVPAVATATSRPPRQAPIAYIMPRGLQYGSAAWWRSMNAQAVGLSRLTSSRRP